MDFDLPKPYPVEKFIMNGKALMLLTKQDFLNRSKLCGDILYHALINLTGGWYFSIVLQLIGYIIFSKINERKAVTRSTISNKLNPI